MTGIILAFLSYFPPLGESEGASFILQSPFHQSNGLHWHKHL